MVYVDDMDAPFRGMRMFHVVELLRFAEADVSAYDVLAVFRYGDRVLHSPRPDFLRTFKPLGGGEDQQLRRDGK